MAGTEAGTAAGTPPADDSGAAAAADGTDWQAEAAKWKAEADEQKKLKRKVEDQNKANAKELERLQTASLTDQERAVATAVQAAKDEVRAETLRQVGGRLVDAEVKAAAASTGLNVDALLQGLDRARFLGDDLEPDTAGITAWVQSLTPQRDAAGFDIGQGARGNGAGSTDLTGGSDFERALIAKVGGTRK
jgi:hypothetical protein